MSEEDHLELLGILQRTREAVAALAIMVIGQICGFTFLVGWLWWKGVFP